MMKKTKCMRRGKNMARLNKTQNASRTVVKQRESLIAILWFPFKYLCGQTVVALTPCLFNQLGPTHPGNASEDVSGNLVKFCESSSSNLTKQIESKLSESVVSLASFNGNYTVICPFFSILLLVFQQLIIETVIICRRYCCIWMHGNNYWKLNGYHTNFDFS